MRKHEINARTIEAVYRVIDKGNLTQTELAPELGCKVSKFTEILKGRMSAGSDLMSFLCEKYDVSADWLLTGRGDVFVPLQQDETADISKILLSQQQTIERLTAIIDRLTETKGASEDIAHIA